jgi:two-component system phosphate regulon response regulator PhoB
MQKILVVDDEQDILDLITYKLERSNYTTIVAKDGLRAIQLAKQEQPDGMVLDLMLPERDGFQVLKDLRRDPATSRLPIIILTARGAVEDRIRGLEFGADDYLAKPFSPKELVLRLQSLLRRAKIPANAEKIESDQIRLDREALKLFIDNENVDLTPTEFKLLLVLMQRMDQPQPRDALLREVWGYGDSTLSRTLDTHIKRVREKLGLYSTRIQTVRGVGYCFTKGKAS